MPTLGELAQSPTRGRFAKCDATWLALNLGGRELRVLLALSLHADWRPTGLGRCYPKRDTIALTTGLQVSHVSEAIGALAKLGLITVVRLGRKNVYYVRPVGSVDPMPPSDAEPFFRYLRGRGVRLTLTAGNQLAYGPESAKFEQLPPLLRAIFNDYANGLVTRKFMDALALLAPETVAA